MKVTQQTKSWGNSTGIRLPKKVLQAAHWQADQHVTVAVKGTSVILTPVRAIGAAKLPSLDELLRGVTPQQVHGEIDWGADRGLEVIND